MISLPIGEVVEVAIDWMTKNLSGFFDIIKLILLGVLNLFEGIFNGIPWFIMLGLIVLICWLRVGKKESILAIIGLCLIYGMNLWSETMETLALVLTATFIALAIGIPLGIWMARSDKLDQIVRPILDFMQTMPAFVYLIPAVYFFDLGQVPGAVATVIFAMPPVVRLTSLGIRQVSKDVIEASDSFGATYKQKLFQVQIPLAMPTILAGLNQTIMLSLSMVVISSMIGGGGLGNVVLRGITQMKVGEGFEGGLAVVILAMILDRVTQSLGKEK
ncbi:ABC transporter permease [Alkalibaculum bacchi]|uniref:ABC transporter permease n=1 Tax=Alkalibaculum bacchi TaxID=645887 RepID=UPI001FA8C41A|nr:proline/glycine betaine ABC transporter permease [Alkalibaculum bacchi]